MGQLEALAPPGMNGQYPFSKPTFAGMPGMGETVAHEDQVAGDQPVVENGSVCGGERERRAERHQATRRDAPGGAIQIEQAWVRHAAEMCRICHATPIRHEVLLWLQAPKQSASSANPSTTMSVAGLGIGSGGPAGPHSWGRRTKAVR